MNKAMLDAIVYEIDGRMAPGDVARSYKYEYAGILTGVDLDVFLFEVYETPMGIDDAPIFTVSGTLEKIITKSSKYEHLWPGIIYSMTNVYVSTLVSQSYAKIVSDLNAEIAQLKGELRK